MRVKSEAVKNGAVLATLDRPIRYTLLISGILSGSGAHIMFKSPHIQNFCTVRHFITCIVLCSFLVTKFILTWNSEEDKIRETLLVNIAYCSWMTHSIINPCILFVAAHGKWGLEKYYEALVDVEARMIGLGAKIGYRKINILVCVVATFFVLVDLYFCVSKIAFYTREGIVDASYFSFFNEKPISLMTLIILNLYHSGVEVYLNFIWTFTLAYFICVCGTQWILLRDYNHHLEQSISANPAVVLSKLADYRITHLRLTGLVAQANRIFSPMLGLIFTANVVIVLLMLYILSYPDPERLATYVIWMTLGVLITSMVIVPSDRVAALTVEAHDTLLELLQDDTETLKDPTLVCQMQMFLSRLQVPESFSAAGMMDINKELGITIVGFLASYYMVLVQFNTGSADLQHDPVLNSTLCSLPINLSSTPATTQ